MNYKIDARKITLAEYSYDSKVMGPVAWFFAKYFGATGPASTDDPPVDVLGPLEVGEGEVPEEVRAGFAPLRAELEGLGFHSPIFHALKDALSSTQYYWATFCHAEGDTLARIQFRHWSTPVPPKVYLAPLFISGFSDGTWLVSTAAKPDMLAPPPMRELRMRGASATALWQAHAAELAREKAGKNWYECGAQGEARQLLEAYHGTLRNFHLERGVFAPLTAEDEARARAVSAAQEQARAAGSEHAEVYAQMEALQHKKGSWSGAILLLVVSLAVFLGAGAARWDWKVLLLMVPVLLFHELGHYAAMRVFKYKNLRMFFIPLFGAAVSGSHYNVAGWKKVIVSLMGPVPGIALGTVMGLAGVYFDQNWLVTGAIFTVILNGFNLLPILPLDGGWVMHTLLFSRHYTLDFGFRVLAVAALVGWGVKSDDRILLLLGVFMAMGLPAALKLARITTRLRKQGLPELSADSQSIPQITAEAIIGEVKAAFPKHHNAKMLAQHTLNVFESLNARPPGWLATIFYLGVHGASIAAALGFFMLLAVAKGGNLESFLAVMGSLPKLELECGAGQSWPAQEISAAGPETQTLAATFADAAGAAEGFEAAKGAHEGAGGVRLMGQTVLISLTATNDALRSVLIEKLDAGSTHLFVQSTNLLATFMLTAVAPDETAAKSIQEEATEYLTTMNSEALIPPWMPGGEFDGKAKGEARLARQTAQRFNREMYAWMESKEYSELSQQINKARQRGDNRQMEQLTKEAERMSERLQEEAARKLATEPDVDKVMVELQLRLHKASTNEAPGIEAEITKRLGAIRLEEGKPAREQARYGVLWGNAVSKRKRVVFNYLSFEDLFYGAPALAKWLCEKGCTKIKYSIHAGQEEEDL